MLGIKTEQIKWKIYTVLQEATNWGFFRVVALLCIEAVQIFVISTKSIQTLFPSKKFLALDKNLLAPLKNCALTNSTTKLKGKIKYESEENKYSLKETTNWGFARVEALLCIKAEQLNPFTHFTPVCSIG